MPFACRNPYALAIDYEKQPPMFRVTDTHYAATWLLDERAAKAREQIEAEMTQGKRAGWNAGGDQISPRI